MWDFETDPDYQDKLDWADDFMRTRVEPLQYVINHPLDLTDPVRQELVPPLCGSVGPGRVVCWRGHVCCLSSQWL